MIKLNKIIFIGVAALGCVSANADDKVPTSSDHLTINTSVDRLVPFNISDTGKKMPALWGLDVAWINESNVLKGINHMGLDNIGIARASYQVVDPLVNDVDLSVRQIATLKERIRIIDLISPTIDLVINEDQEATQNSMPEYYRSKNNVIVREHWAAAIAATVRWIHANTQHKVKVVSVFNEPDYGWSKATKNDFYHICRILREQYPEFKDILFSAGNTLNSDPALSWYNAVKPYVTWGNTHQLAGSFDTYASFFAQVAADGNYPTADEMHNICDAMVGAEYGMKAGIWWGFDSRARGELCDISNHGSRLGYAEHRPNWTAAAVYRNDETKAVRAFVGSSERQAATTGYLFVSKDREVYADGAGPSRDFYMQMPGGTGYQKGQTNAERVINVDYGEDVPPSVINGRYKLMNVTSKTVVAENGRSGGNTNISMLKYTGGEHQQWDITLVDPRNGGDYSYYKITSVKDGNYMNVLNNSKSNGANVISYNAGGASNEQWALEYAGNGAYYIKNRESGLYLEPITVSSADGVNVRQGKLKAPEYRHFQQWRIIPVDAACETTAPAIPTELKAVGQAASVKLTWKANGEDDLDGYMIVRAKEGTDEWNTIARKVKATTFIDNTCRQGESYLYKIKAIDRSDNMSAASAQVKAEVTGTKGLVAQWQLDDLLQDNTLNHFDAVSAKNPVYVAGKSGEKAMVFGGSDYLRLPYQVGDMDEMTVCLWVYWKNTSSAWQRIFDFGTDTEHYMFLTPSEGNKMRFAIKNGGEEQQLDYALRLTGYAWHHVAVTMAKGKVSIFVDGIERASTTDITIKPSDLKPVFNYIGHSQFATDPNFVGNIDDIRIYNYALTAGELTNVMEDVTNGIKDLPVSADNDSKDYYRLDGTKVSKPTKGLYIHKGRKYVK